jgi:NADH dehydrogenase
VILVAGGTGRLGAELVPSLVSAGLPVRVLTRDAARAEHLRAPGVQVVVGDVRHPATLGSATSGVTTVVSAVHGFAATDGGSPARVDRDGNAALVDVAAAVGARVVLLSVLGAAADHPLALFRMKAAAEQCVRTHVRDWTIVRAASFAEMQLDLLCRTAGAGRSPVVLGRGRNPVNVVSVADVAAVAVAALAAPASHDQFTRRVVDVGGPEDLTLDQLAAAAQRRLGCTGPIRHVPLGVLRALAAAQGLPRIPLGQVAALAVAVDTMPMTYDALHDEGALTWRGTRRVDDLCASAGVRGGRRA